MGGILVQYSESSGNLDVLAENLGTLDLGIETRIVAALPRGGLGRSGCLRLC